MLAPDYRAEATRIHFLRRQMFTLLAMTSSLPGALAAPSAPIPAQAPNCALAAPPESAGAYVTPGGFLLVHPRNKELAADYTGCKTLWVEQAEDHTPLLARLYFDHGTLRLGEFYDPDGALRTRCSVPDTAPECSDMAANPLAALHLPTWPRSCTRDADRPECAADPD
jgi:hypothetical protein